MRVLVAGATGAIGRPLVARLLAGGHAVTALVRSPEKAAAVLGSGVKIAAADVFDAEAVKAAVAAHRPEVVIEQLTSLPRRYTREEMAAAAPLNNRLRLEGGDNLLAAARASGVRKYLRQSIAFFAVPGPGLADEVTPLAVNGPPAVAGTVRTLIELENRLLDCPLEGLVLRYGFFYGPGTWFHLAGDVAEQVRNGQWPIIGRGEGVWSWLHIDDAAIATVLAAEKGRRGVYLIADDTPLPVSEWLPAFARYVGAPPPPQVPVQDALKSAGPDAVYYGTQMRGASNAKAKRELGFQPRALEWM